MSENHLVPPGRYRNSQSFVSTRPKCPVCKKDVYSGNDIHPQCSVVREEDAARAIRKVETAAAAAAALELAENQEVVA